MSDAPSYERTAPRAGLAARLRVRRGNFELDLPLDVAPGEVVALVGPNGAGKTTALHALAGLLPLTDGRIELDGRVLDDPARRILVPPERRPLGVVFQDYLLFPHLSARDNVAFGLRTRGVPRTEARRRAETWLERVGVGDLAGLRPSSLSGGQAQRVALARALAPGPRLLLLDEPMAALDAATRLTVRADLAHHLQDYDGAAVLVTHDPLDAMSLADRIVVLEDGRVVQEGAPVDVARAPRTEYVARLVGLNLLRGEGRGGVVELDEGGVVHLAEPAQGPVLVAFPPSAVVLHRHRPEGSARNTWHGRVTALEQHAHTVRAQVAIDDGPSVLADVTAAAVAELGLGLGVPVWVSFKATETHAYPA
ncbi:MAG TPA: ABC transporter ATP-binding protein [Ornithinicoccus sp.]|nr:ABC transporter ATP-binding protein [Ornithinicoccus sp.]